LKKRAMMQIGGRKINDVGRYRGKSGKTIREVDCHAFILQQLRQVNAGARGIAPSVTRRRII
jgi:hypothetical protein